jgi:hypothetical protein
MADVGPVVAQQFLGTANVVTGVVLTFDVPLDPTTATNPDSYRFIKKFQEDDDGGFLGGGDGVDETDSTRVRILSATYDATANQVTLTPTRNFSIGRTFTVIQVQGSGENAVRTTLGENLDGDGNGRPGGDLNLRYRAATRKSFSFREADGDRVTFKIAGPGRILYFYATRHRSSPSLFLRDSEASTLLSATVKPGRRGDGVIDIAQISDVGLAQAPALTNPGLRIRPMPS